MKRVSLFGFEFVSSSSYQPLLASILNKKYDKDPYLISPNLFQVVKYSKEEDLYHKFKNASYIIPDGQPVVISSKLVGKPLARRLTGSDLFCLFWEKAKESKIPVYIVSPNVSTAKQLESENENLTYYSPKMFHLEDKRETERVVNQIVENVLTHQPEYVIIGLGFPKQEHLAFQLNHQLSAKGIECPLIMLLGASLEFYTGHKTRAPLWIQNIGMEWFHRFLTEPIRLFKRYFIDSFQFLPILIKEIRNR